MPAGHESEYLGFHSLAGRSSAGLGPLIFGAVSAITGSQRAAMLSLSVFLIAGARCLARVRVNAPRTTPVA